MISKFSKYLRLSCLIWATGSISTNAIATGHTEHLDFNDGTILGYLAYLPPSYETNEDSLPLIIFLHGAGQRAADGVPNLNQIYNTALPQILETKDIPFIVISPQVRYTWNDTHESINDFLDYLLETYPRIDPRRVFITGISDGGKGVFDFPLYYRERVTAIIPVSSWPSDANSVPISTAPYFESPAIPVWGFHGSDDGYGSMETWINQLNTEGGDAEMTLLPGGHSAAVWNTVYQGEQYDIYTWMLEQSLDPSDFPQWADWRVRNNWVNTNERKTTIGWLYLTSTHWVYSYSFNRYIYIDQSNVNEGRGWGYIQM